VCGEAKYRRTMKVSGGGKPGISLQLARGADVLEAALALVEDLRLASEALAEEKAPKGQD
jgi:hypothetical protein